MKQVFIVLTMLIAAHAVQAQNAVEVLSNHIAQKMKDTLQLGDIKKQQIYLINMQLHQLKMSKRMQYAGTDSVRYYLQKVENTRDSLYHTVLSDSVFTIYQQKKRALVSAN